jgi:hypothetical protein
MADRDPDQTITLIDPFLDHDQGSINDRKLLVNGFFSEYYVKIS